MKISEVGEFGLISRIADKFGNLTPDGWDGIGDDCAVIPLDSERSMVVTTDMLIEDVHFLRSRISAWELGRKALTVNLSDIAAMGATAQATFLSLGLPSDLEVDWCDAFFEGYRSLGVPLLGGDTTSSQTGIVINITVIGECPTRNIKRRRDAQIGDYVVVTSALGDSAVGLQLMLSDSPKTDCTQSDCDELIAIHHNPRPFLKQGPWLGNQPAVHSMMDVSDGLASDLGHILRSSKCGATIDLDAIPVSDIARQVAGQMGWNITTMAVTGGEDYALLLTVAPDDFQRLEAEYYAAFGEKLYIVGLITDATDGDYNISWSGKHYDSTDNNRLKGFRHF